LDGTAIWILDLIVCADAPNNTAGLSGLVKRGSFPRSARLLRPSDFERVYKQGKRHFATHFTVFYLPRATTGGPRIGFTVGRALGGAVDRNRMKRRLREAVRSNCMEESVCVDVVINPKKSLLRAEFPELLEQSKRAFDVVQKFSKAGRNEFLR
jgi:ribonuclease P protein component